MLRISLTLEGHFAKVKPLSFLGDTDLWNAYRKAAEGAQYDKARKASFATLDKVPGIIKRLRQADFAVVLDNALQEALSKQEAQTWLDIQAATERVELVDGEIKAMGKAGLFPFQKTGVVWLCQKGGALLADEMGLGKTLQCLAALPAGAPTLVVAPAVAKGVWQREVRKWRPNKRVSLLKGKGSFRWPEKNEVLVTNYDILPDVHTASCLKDRKDKKTIVTGKHTKECLKARKNVFLPAIQEVALKCQGCLTVADVAKECKGCLPFLEDAPTDMVLVADEAHNLKSGVAQRSVKFKGISYAVRKKGGKTWLLTATPLVNRPPELWAVLDTALIAQEVFGDYKTFLRIFGARKASEFGGLVFGDPDSEAVAERLQRVMLRRLRTEVMPELPRKTLQEQTVEIDKKTVQLASAYVQNYGGLDNITKQLGKGLAFDTMSRVRAALATSKIPAMVEIVEDYESQEEPLVVFSAHRAPIDLLGKRPGWEVITGDTPPHKRSEIEDRFQKGELKGVASTIKAGGVAITLTRACHALFVDLEWSPALNSQAEDRICRIGQTRPCVITVLVADHPLDARVNELLLGKRELIDASVDAARDVPVEMEGGA